MGGAPLCQPLSGGWDLFGGQDSNLVADTRAIPSLTLHTCPTTPPPNVSRYFLPAAIGGIFVIAGLVVIAVPRVTALRPVAYALIALGLDGSAWFRWLRYGGLCYLGGCDCLGYCNIPARLPKNARRLPKAGRIAGNWVTCHQCGYLCLQFCYTLFECAFFPRTGGGGNGGGQSYKQQNDDELFHGVLSQHLK